MALLLVILAAALVFVIAAVVIGRETRRLDAEAPRPVFDLEEAVAWVAARLPEPTTARLTPGDVRQVMEWALECFATAEPDPEFPGGESLVEDDDALAYVAARAARAGLELEEVDVRAVLAAQTAYLAVIGAVRSIPPERGGGPAEQ